MSTLAEGQSQVSVSERERERDGERVRKNQRNYNAQIEYIVLRRNDVNWLVLSLFIVSDVNKISNANMWVASWDNHELSHLFGWFLI